MQPMLRLMARSGALAVLYLTGLSLLAPPAAARSGSTLMPPSAVVELPAAQTVTPESTEPVAFNAAAPRMAAPFRPTMDAGTYARIKASAARASLSQGGRTGRSAFPLPRVPSVPSVDVNFEGLNQTQSGDLGFTFTPPDTHGAIGKSQFVETVNLHIAVYGRDGTLLKSVPISALFGTPPANVFYSDPRVLYDRLWDRWVIAITTFNLNTEESPYVGIAVSQTGDATGAFYVNRLTTNAAPLGTAGNLFDYPMLGMDQDAVLLTANIFFAGPVTATTLSIAKARLYNGLSLRLPVFKGLIPTLAPPIVLDDNPRTYLAAARLGAGTVALYALTNSSRPDAAALSILPAVNVGAFSTPRPARQRGTSATLDSLDGRFQNASTQIGNSLFNVHTIGLGGYSTPRWYEINTTTGAIVQSGTFFGSDTSDDINPHIAASDAGDVFATWTSSDPGTRTDPGYFPQVRASSKLRADDPGVMSPGSVVFQSPTFYTGGRWGDYSAVTLDPLDASSAWGINEKVNSPSVWGTRIFRITTSNGAGGGE